jgi:hypothetical protein
MSNAGLCRMHLGRRFWKQSAADPHGFALILIGIACPSEVSSKRQQLIVWLEALDRGVQSLRFLNRGFLNTRLASGQRRYSPFYSSSRSGGSASNIALIRAEPQRGYWRDWRSNSHRLRLHHSNLKSPCMLP